MSERDLFINTYFNEENDIYSILSDKIKDIDVVYRWDDFDIAQTFDNTKILICYKYSSDANETLDSTSLKSFIKEMYELKFRQAVIVTNYKFLDKNVIAAISSLINYNVHIDIKVADTTVAGLTGICKILCILFIIVYVYTEMLNI